MPNGIRVLRILEYTYENAGYAETDMARWTHVSPRTNRSMRMRDTVLPFETIEWSVPPDAVVHSAVELVAHLYRDSSNWSEIASQIDGNGSYVVNGTQLAALIVALYNEGKLTDAP